MKKILFVSIFMVAMATQAQENADFKTETVEFLKLTGAGKAFESAIDQIGYNVPEANKEVYTKEAMGTLDALYAKMADLYMSEFTQSEIKELIVFYHTDLGKKLAEKQLSLTQKGMSFGQTWGMEVSQIAQKYTE
ncbi:DUF2059 domain-containing protein [Mariniflexile sp. HNIBRBA6329]|uniref:DUF2059 domain-containing protein n=1 Tax=Mariniflexile sp. HNIBRBA6329 TaxID=3373088 RepID=UPI003746C17C